MDIKTRFLLMSDTHGDRFPIKPDHRADVVIHCGDLTEESKLEEFRIALQFLKELDAPLKLVVAGNHDFTLDVPTFKERIGAAAQRLDPDLVRKEFGDYGEARRLMDEAKDDGVVFLDEGTHHFILQNGARLAVYASPYTPSNGGWGFEYAPGTERGFAIEKSTDVVITHGPPLGIMDLTRARTRAGCAGLFGAVAGARPRLHCFGHIHEGWGAKLVTWREQVGDKPNHFADVDNERSVVVDKLANFKGGKFDTEDVKAEKWRKGQELREMGYRMTSHCAGDENPLRFGEQTLFVNAAIQGSTDETASPPWLVDIELPLATTTGE